VRLLVIGGSQGAARLNAVVPFALKRLAGLLSFDVRHQAGERWLEAGRASYAEAGVGGGGRPLLEGKEGGPWGAGPRDFPPGRARSPYPSSQSRAWPRSWFLSRTRSTTTRRATRSTWCARARGC